MNQIIKSKMIQIIKTATFITLEIYSVIKFLKNKLIKFWNIVDLV